MMIKEKNLTNAEKKRIESLDKRIEKIQNKIAVNRKEYDAMTKELQKLLEERYPERRSKKIKTTLYEAYSHSDRSLDDILAFIEGRDDDIDWCGMGKTVFRVLFSGSSHCSLRICFLRCLIIDPVVFVINIVHITLFSIGDFTIRFRYFYQKIQIHNASIYRCIYAY